LGRDANSTSSGRATCNSAKWVACLLTGKRLSNAAHVDNALSSHALTELCPAITPSVANDAANSLDKVISIVIVVRF
jgi:hypothetical protein